MKYIKYTAVDISLHGKAAGGTFVVYLVRDNIISVSEDSKDSNRTIIGLTNGEKFTIQKELEQVKVDLNIDQPKRPVKIHS